MRRVIAQDHTLQVHLDKMQPSPLGPLKAPSHPRGTTALWVRLQKLELARLPSNRPRGLSLRPVNLMTLMLEVNDPLSRRSWRILNLDLSLERQADIMAQARVSPRSPEKFDQIKSITLISRFTRLENIMTAVLPLLIWEAKRVRCPT